MKRIIQATLVSFITLLLAACFLYEEKIYDNPFDPALTDGATPIPYADIQLDGDTSEWDSIMTFISDQTNEETNSGQPSIPGGDIDQFKMAQNDENLYFYLSTANGVPLETAETGFSLGLQDENDNFSLNFLNFFHSVNESIDSWSNYDYRIDDTNWSGYSIPSSIRFSGLNMNENAIEFGISKIDYWNLINTNTRLRVNMNTWYDPYHVNFGDGTLDDTRDTDHEYLIVLKTADEPDPSEDVPIVQFDRPSSPLNIDGYSSDLNIWGETGYWYQDFTGDNIGSEPNGDIDKIYMKQDDQNIYVLITFNDPGIYDGSGLTVSYNLNLSASNGSINQTLHADHDGSVTWNINIDGNPLNCLAASAEPGYLELQFDKTEGWDSLPFGAFNFFLEVYDNSSVIVDRAAFIGSYKSLTDPTPAP